MASEADIIIRDCTSLGDFEQCVCVQRSIWGFEENDLVPRRLFVVVRKTPLWAGGRGRKAHETAILVGKDQIVLPRVRRRDRVRLLASDLKTEVAVEKSHKKEQPVLSRRERIIEEKDAAPGGQRGLNSNQLATHLSCWGLYAGEQPQSLWAFGAVRLREGASQ